MSGDRGGSETDGVLKSRFGAQFGQAASFEARKAADRSASRTPAERARAAKVELKMCNFKFTPGEDMMLDEAASLLGLTRTAVVKQGIQVILEQAKRKRST
jgi:hypothetical protein